MIANHQTIPQKRQSSLKGTTMIRWGRDELKKVALNWIAICRANNVDPLKHQGMLKTLVQAQQILPQSRHRTEKSLTGKPSQQPILDYVKQFLEVEKVNNVSLSETHAIKPEIKPVEVESKKELELGTGLADRPIPFIPRELPNDKSPSYDLSFDELITGFAEGIASIFVEETVKALKKSFLRELPKLSMRALQVSKTLPKILIVGPMQKQQPQLEESVAGVADLKFVSSDESPRLVALRGNSCIACILWTNYISHPHQEAAKKLFSSNNLRLVTGGLERLRDELEGIAIMLPENNNA